MLVIKDLSPAQDDHQKLDPIIKIQSLWRGYSVRTSPLMNRLNLLSSGLVEKAKPFIASEEILKKLSRSSLGTVPVYFPKGLPIVLKKCGSPENQMRFIQQKEARAICNRSGYQNLEIPRSQVLDNFIIESRLPLGKTEMSYQIGLYLENRDRFTDAVKEFMGLLCQSNFADIAGSRRRWYQSIANFPLGRYDNLPLYLVNGKGKIGLVDLEHFDATHTSIDKARCCSRCKDAIHIFPYHFEEILEVAKSFVPAVEEFKKELEVERDKAQSFFKAVFEEHLTFIKTHGITFENPAQPIYLDNETVERLKKLIENKLLEGHQKNLSEDGFYTTSAGCLGEDSSKTLKEFVEAAFPTLIGAIHLLMEEGLKKNLHEFDPERSSQSYAELLPIRSLAFRFRDDDENLGAGLGDQMVGLILPHMHMLNLIPSKRFSLAIHLLHYVFVELAALKKIVYYNNSYDIGMHTRWLVLC